MTDTDVKLIQAALDAGPTLGEWKTHGAVLVYSKEGNVCQAGAPNASRWIEHIEAERGTEAFNTACTVAEYIAACSPDRIARLLAERGTTKEESMNYSSDTCAGQSSQGSIVGGYDEKANYVSRTIGQNIDDRIAALRQEIERLQGVKAQLQSGASLLDVRIEDLRSAMNY